MEGRLGWKSRAREGFQGGSERPERGAVTKETVTLLGEQKKARERRARLMEGVSSVGEHHAHLPPPFTTTSALTWLLQPEFAEAVLVLLEHVPHPQAAAVRPVPLLQLQEAGVTAERHDAEGSWS